MAAEVAASMIFYHWSFSWASACERHRFTMGDKNYTKRIHAQHIIHFSGPCANDMEAAVMLDRAQITLQACQSQVTCPIKKQKTWGFGSTSRLPGPEIAATHSETSPKKVPKEKSARCELTIPRSLPAAPSTARWAALSALTPGWVFSASA